MSRSTGPLIASLLLSLSLAVASEEPTRLLRYPDVHQDQVVFVYAGDLWTVKLEGGVARRLTSHEGQEIFPKFSPDGRWIAFSGEYGGNRQVFVISVDGGTPRQLTWYNDVGPMPPRGGFDHRIIGWTPDGKNVVFRGNRLPWGVRMGRYFKVPLSGGLETPLAIPETGGGDLSMDGRRVAYTPIDREFRTWKRYKGGRAQDVWVYDLKTDTAEQITDYEGTDNQPVWLEDTIYFTSDRDRKLNLYAHDTGTGETRKVTDHQDYDVLWPSAGPSSIVYQNGGYLYRYEPKSGDSTRLPIGVYGDLPYTVPYLKNVQENVEAADISPSGARAVLEARGDLFTVPAEKGEIRNLTRTQGIREMSPVWSPDGKWVAYLSDRSGEYELYVRAQDGTGEERRITRDGGIWRFDPIWSPDSKKLAFADKRQTLYYVDLDDGKSVVVDRDSFADITTYTWSPDSAWIAYVKQNENQNAVIHVHSLDDGRSHALTDPLMNNFSPAFDPDGKYLYFLSQRDFNMTFSSWEFNYVYTNPTRLYLASLAADTPLPFAPESDEEEPEDDSDADEDEEANEEDADGDEDSGLEVRIDIDGFSNRVVALPGESGNYRSLTGTESGVMYLVGGGGETALKSFNLEDEKEETILEGVSGYVLSADEEKILYRSGGDFGVVANQPGQENSEGRLDLGAMDMKIDPRAEWAQLFTDAWRIFRDWFYDPGLHGQDWEAHRERYAELVPHVAHRADLDFILGELGGELNAGHVYIQSGDQPTTERQDGGLLGAELEAHRSGYYRFAKIFAGENWHEDFRSPLTQAGVDVKEGDFLIAIDGQKVSTDDNPYRFLENKAGHVVTLTVSSEPSGKETREEKVRAIARETNLRYLDWVLERRRRVDEASGGRIGYIHLPDTATDGNRELVKYFYPQAGKEALILDARYNGGGFVPDRMIELLDRPVLNWWVGRGTEPTSVPGYSHEGPKACLINGLSSSGGDAFPYYFRKRGLGPLIGTRTWGGLIGLSGNPGLMDGGTVLVPTFRFLDTEGAWDVEGIGVAPDVEVLDRPGLVAQGRDPSLEKAIEMLLAKLPRNPVARVTVPPAPVDRP